MTAKSRHHREAVPLIRAHPGCMAIAQVSIPNADPIVVVSMYGMIHESYAVTTVQGLLNDLTPLIDSALGKRLVVGGDLNLSTQLDPPHRQRHQNVFERFEAFGLVNLLSLRNTRTPLEGCPCDDAPCRHVQTHRHNRSDKPWQDDYLFASKALAERLTNSYALDSGDPDPWSLSDHCPVVAEFDLEGT